MEHPVDNAFVRLTATFEGAPLTVITLGDIDAPFWIARQVGEALGYPEPARLVTLVTGEWSTELVEGTDYRKLTGEDLATVKAALGPDVIDPRTPSLLLLTQSGVFAAALLSRQPAAARLRRWLSAEVLPQIAHTGAYTPPETTTAPAPRRDARDERLAWLAELRARMVVSDLAFIRETHRLLGIFPPAVGDPLHDQINWLRHPTFDVHAWPQVRDAIGTWNPTAVRLDIRWHRFQASKGINLPARAALAQRYGISVHVLNDSLAYRTEWHPLLAFDVTPQEWAELREAFRTPWARHVARLDAVWHRDHQTPITWAQLAEAWGWPADDVRQVLADLVGEVAP